MGQLSLIQIYSPHEGIEWFLRADRYRLFTPWRHGMVCTSWPIQAIYPMKALNGFYQLTDTGYLPHEGIEMFLRADRYRLFTPWRHWNVSTSWPMQAIHPKKALNGFHELTDQAIHPMKALNGFHELTDACYSSHAWRNWMISELAETNHPSLACIEWFLWAGRYWPSIPWRFWIVYMCRPMQAIHPLKILNGFYKLADTIHTSLEGI